MLQSCAQSDIGQRKVNEDSYLIDENLGLYVVADGVGGMAKGEVASQVACQTVLHNIQSGIPLEESVYLAHREIINKIKSNESKQGMATTIVVVLFQENSYEVAWVGDSRLYLWDGQLKLLTKDDSYVELLLENGHISIDELDTHPDRNVISQALGIERKDININTNAGTLEKGQILLLCSDGLYGVAKELDMIESLKAGKKIDEITLELVNLVAKKQGKDNITLLSIKSDTNSIQSHEANVFRKFELETGEVVSTKVISNLDSEIQMNANEETDPELIDQTVYRDLSEEQRNLLDLVAQQSNEENKTPNKLIFVQLVTILALITYILLK